MSEKRLDVQRAIVALVKGYEFPKVSYNADGSPRPTHPDQYLKAATPILCNEVRSEFAIDRRHGRDRILERTTWQFALKIRFAGEVLLEGFEDTLANDPPYVDDANATIFLLGGNVDHPVQQDGKTGTQVEYVFQAVEGRK